ncbi:Cloroperoxidase [Gloeopeniophorella convolvens]|nr:Cloroperoxidase [Gloeopeniophorella convolvens]
MAFIVTALRRIGRGTFSRLYEAIFFSSILFWDFSLAIVNTFTFKRKIGTVVPKGSPGEGGVWPEYIPPREDDSRCSCPALNAMANHGIISRDGRNISFREVTDTVRSTYNFSPTFCLFVPRYIAHILGRSYKTGHLDLADIDVHNGIEHDASLFRRDTFHDFHQGMPDPELVAAFIKAASGPPLKDDAKYTPPGSPGSPSAASAKTSPYAPIVAHVAQATAEVDLSRTLTPRDLSRCLGERRREAKAANPQFSQDTGHKMFGSSNASTLLTIFGGRTRDIYTFLTEERLPEGWESRVRERMGLTMLAFNSTVFRVELGIEEEVQQPLNLM